MSANILILIKYGTYLDHLVKEVLRSHSEPLSVKEIALLLTEAEMPPRQFRNLQVRIRRAAEQLVHEEIFLKEKHRLGGNLLCWKYSFNTKTKLDL